MIKLIVIRVFCLILIIFGLNALYKITFYEDDLSVHAKEILKIKKTQDATDIYYFGESSNTTFVKDQDSLYNSISELAAMFFPGLRFTNINKEATHAGIYTAWIKTFDVSKTLPKALIVTLNLRSFNAAWINSNLETQLQQTTIFTRPFPPLVNRFFLSLQAFDNQTDEQREKATLADWKTTKLLFPFPFKYQTVSQWDAGMANGTYLKPDGSWDQEKIVLACHYVKAYALNLNENNKRIRDFDEIFQWSQRYKVPLYLNLLAENVQYADSLVGKELVFLMQQNRQFLMQRYNKGFCKVIDNLDDVPGKYFIDQNWTTEHYNFKGRLIIANNIADTLKKQFKNEYKAHFNYVR